MKADDNTKERSHGFAQMRTLYIMVKVKMLNAINMEHIRAELFHADHVLDAMMKQWCLHEVKKTCEK